jgi:hypothetical protein
MPRGAWVDDPTTIPDDTPLWRGIVVSQIKSSGLPSRGEFTFRELSVNVSIEATVDMVVAKGLRAGRTWRFWEFTAGTARRAGCIVDRDPEPDDESHAVVLHPERPGQKNIDLRMAQRIVAEGRWQDQ